MDTRFPSYPECTRQQNEVRKAFWQHVKEGGNGGASHIADVLGRSFDSVQSSIRGLASMGLIPRRARSSTKAGNWIDLLPTEFSEEEEELHTKGRLVEAEKRLASYKEGVGSIRGMVRDMCDYVRSIPPPVISVPKVVPEESVDVVVHNTDWHMGAVQDSDEVEGFNSFSPEVLRHRVMDFAGRVIKSVEMHRSEYEVRTCHVLVTGDLISGDIHEELRTTNAFPAPVQCVEAGRLLAQEVSYLSGHFQKVVVHGVCADNHGRLSKKAQHKEGGYNSFNYPLFELCKAMLADHVNVEMHIYPQEEVVVEVRGRRYLLCHGHQVTGWAGFPYYGISRKVGMEAVKRMGRHPFDRVVLGHWHAPLCHPNFWIGGSISGTDAYDHSQGRLSVPTQASWYVSRTEFDRTDWVLDS